MQKEYRLVVAGCRNYTDYLRVSREIKKYIEELGSGYSIIIVSGCSNGTDALGERFADNHKLKVEKYPAEWNKYGRAAGPLRNAQMAKVADGIIVFWDGASKGTKNMIESAKKENKPCTIINI